MTENKRIPDFRHVSQNMRGMAAYGRDNINSRKRKAEVVRKLVSTNDITNLQDTKLNRREGSVLNGGYINRIIPREYRAYYSNLSNHQKGVCTILSPHVLSLYYIRQPDLPETLRGRVIYLWLEAKGDYASFPIVNVYFESGGDSVTIAKQLSLIKGAVPPAPYMRLSGDFNFVEDRFEDTASHSVYYEMTDAFKEAWVDFIDHYSLKEVAQNTHTFLDLGNLDCPASSRLDRHYINLDEAEWAALKPYTYIPYTPHSILHSIATNGTSNGGNSSPKQGNKRHNASDHLPVALDFAVRHEKSGGKSNDRVSIWEAEDPRYLPLFEKNWSETAHQIVNMDCFGILEALKRCMHKAGTGVRRAQKEKRKNYTSSLSELNAIVKAIRLHQARDNSPHAQRFFCLHPHLEGSDIETLKGLAGPLLKKGEVEDKDNRTAKTRIDHIKICLPSTRERLHALRPNLDSDLVTDPTEMAKLAHGYWSKIWSPRQETDDHREPEEYYGDFRRRIPPELIPLIPGIPELEDAIRQTNNSCAGPDGLPFAAYRTIFRHAAPVLALVLQGLAAGQLPHEGYNDGLLFLISKKGTLLPSDTRPISVTNTDNRIITKAVVAAITPSLIATLHGAQKGFIEGRVFEDHIRDLNETFYEAVENPSSADFHALFMDTEKAFDSINHDFIHVALERAGLPDWVRHLIAGLLHQCRVKPAFFGAEEIWIPVLRGVKQGCPMSPLLFVICYDVLLQRIDDIDGVTPFACADDLA